MDESGVREATAAWVCTGIPRSRGLEAIDELTFGAVLGAFDPAGELIVVIQALDNAANLGRTGRLSIPVKSCIG